MSLVTFYQADESELRVVLLARIVNSNLSSSDIFAYQTHAFTTTTHGLWMGIG
jgi:hypothetical protein